MSKGPLGFEHDPAAIALEALIRSVVAAVVRGDTPEQLYAVAEALAPAWLKTQPDHPREPGRRRAMIRGLAREIAAEVPQPALRFGKRKLARPGRNEPCDCGSGRKYKHCCQPLEQTRPLGNFNLLPYVLAILPRKRWAELAGSAIDPAAVSDAAHNLLEQGEHQKASALLEPWFRGTSAIVAAHEELLDLLLDTYTALAQPRKKRSLLRSALDRGDRVIRSSVYQRLATMAADEGDYDTAWRHFRDAQREHADAASLAHLEIVLLLSQGEQAQARERARFWIARLQRTNASDYAELIALLRDVAEQGEQALLELQYRRWPPLGMLHELLQHAPALAVHHTFPHETADDLGALHADRPLARALKAWRRAFPQNSPDLTGLAVEDDSAWIDPSRWLDCLQAHPLLWQSFEVLDDLLLALGVIYQVGMRSLRDALLSRAEGLLHATLDHRAGKTLPWVFPENRPALRLLAQRIAADAPSPAADMLARMEWMLALNPDDNHGYREAVMAHRLRQGEPARAMALAERYPGDTGLAFGRALALYALDRPDEALPALRDAHQQLPLIAPMLAAAKPRKPKLSPGWVRHGGADQAWLYREAYLPAWQAYDGALDWLRASLRAFKRK